MHPTDHRDLIRRSAQLLSSALPLHEVLAQFAVLISGFVEAAVVKVAVGGENEAHIEYEFERETGHRPNAVNVLAGSAVQQVLITGKPVLQTKSVFVPVEFGGSVVGVLGVQSLGLEAYDQDDVAALESCAIYLGARLNDEARRAEFELLKHEAETDALTSVANRRAFDGALAREWQRCGRSRTSLSMLLLDVDFFKVFNDTYGHIAGDGCLKQIAKAITAFANRPGDFVARYGGEEFAILLPETRLESSLQIAEEICAAVRALQVPHQGSSLGYTTVSIGCACVVPDAGTQPQTLTEQADTYLYRAKEHGRNRVAGESHLAHAPAAQRQAPLKHNLPPARTSFLGRERELARMEQIRDAPLLTLTGPGGVGKTRLAIEFANRSLERYHDGVWFVDLAPVSDPQFISAAVLASLGVRENIIRDSDETLMSYLATKSALIVLDNCEHLVDAVARLVDRILDECPSIKTIATSREVLAISGEALCRISPFDDDEGVALFATRAQAVAPEFAVTTKNADALKQICRRLDGIPLAIELAAARVKTLSFDDLLAQLDHRFRLLAHGSRNAVPRHQTLYGLIDWSHNLLEEKEKALFRRSAIFAGAFTLEAAEAVCAAETIEPWEVLDLLGQLIDKSLVQLEAGGRYALLESNKAYGLERLDEAGERETMALRRARHFAGAAERAWTDFFSRERDERMAATALDYADYRATLQWALAEGADVALGAGLASALFPYWTDRGQAREGMYWLEQVLSLGAEIVGEPHWARTLYGLSAMYFLQGKYDRMEETARQADAAYASLGDLNRRAVMQNSIAIAARLAGRYDEACELYEFAATIAREVGNLAVEFATLCNLGELFTDWKCDYARANEFYTQAEAIVEGHKGLTGATGTFARGTFLGDWSRTLAYQGTLDRAIAMVRDALELFRDMGEVHGILEQTIRLGHYLIWNGDCASALPPLGDAAERLKKLDHPLEIVHYAEACADLAAACNLPLYTATLLGFCDEWRTRHNLARPRPLHERFEALDSAARATLGDEAFAAGWESGRMLAPDASLNLSRSLLSDVASALRR